MSCDELSNTMCMTAGKKLSQLIITIKHKNGATKTNSIMLSLPTTHNQQLAIV